MAQFDVRENRSPRTRGEVPYFLIVQSNLLKSVLPLVVAPLWHRAAFTHPMLRLNPCFVVDGHGVVMQTTGLIGVAEKELGPYVDNLEAQRHEIIAALDFLFTGV